MSLKTPATLVTRLPASPFAPTVLRFEIAVIV
jgi:hypothetical protein